MSSPPATSKNLPNIACVLRRLALAEIICINLRQDIVELTSYGEYFDKHTRDLIHAKQGQVKGTKKIVKN